MLIECWFCQDGRDPTHSDRCSTFILSLSTTAPPPQASSSSLRVQSSALLDILSCEVGEQCCAVVKALKAIAATYRMTTKGPPVRHSHYASGVLAPLATLLASPQVGHVAALFASHFLNLGGFV